MARPQPGSHMPGVRPGRAGTLNGGASTLTCVDRTRVLAADHRDRDRHPHVHGSRLVPAPPHGRAAPTPLARAGSGESRNECPALYWPTPPRVRAGLRPLNYKVVIVPGTFTADRTTCTPVRPIGRRRHSHVYGPGSLDRTADVSHWPTPSRIRVGRHGGLHAASVTARHPHVYGSDPHLRDAAWAEDPAPSRVRVGPFPTCGFHCGIVDKRVPDPHGSGVPD